VALGVLNPNLDLLFIYATKSLPQPLPARPSPARQVKCSSDEG